MQWIIVGLGNPDKVYIGTRHNVGRDTLLYIAKKEGLTSWKEDREISSTSVGGTLFDKKVLLLLPNTYMNNSGNVFKKISVSKAGMQKLIVLQDELDLPLGTIKLSFGSGSGGHKGIESLHRFLKTKNFLRIRIGISPSAPSGKLKKPSQDSIPNFVLGIFRPQEIEKLKKVRTKVARSIELVLNEGTAHAMTMINAKS